MRYHFISDVLRIALCFKLTLLSCGFRHQEDWLEQNIYQEMALTASAFAYTWSKWNADCGKDKIIIQAVEQLQDEQPLEVVTILIMRMH